MKTLILFLLSCLPVLSYSQRLHLNLTGGIMNYQGDLQDKPFTFEQSGLALGAGLKYDLSHHLSLRTGIMYGKVRADDRYNKPLLQLRNLSFETRILEGSVLVEYNLFDLDTRKFTPYFFAGAGIFHFDPFTYDTLGARVYLQPLSTEGQGLAQYPDRKKYSLTQFNIPIGMGVKARLSENIVIGYEIGMRKLFTDHFDDVSSTYVDAGALLAARGPKAVEMAYRGGEVKNGNPLYPAAGTIRGGASAKDWYYSQGITLSIGLHAFSEGRGWRNRGQGLDCPGRVL